MQLAQVGSNWLRLEATGSGWKQLAQVGSNWLRLEATGSGWKTVNDGIMGVCVRACACVCVCMVGYHHTCSRVEASPERD